MWSSVYRPKPRSTTIHLHARGAARPHTSPVATSAVTASITATEKPATARGIPRTAVLRMVAREALRMGSGARACAAIWPTVVTVLFAICRRSSSADAGICDNSSAVERNSSSVIAVGFWSGYDCSVGSTCEEGGRDTVGRVHSVR